MSDPTGSAESKAWEARWAAVRELLTNAVMPVADHYLREMDRIEARIPVAPTTSAATCGHREYQRWCRRCRRELRRYVRAQTSWWGV